MHELGITQRLLIAYFEVILSFYVHFHVEFVGISTENNWFNPKWPLHDYYYKLQWIHWPP